MRNLPKLVAVVNANGRIGHVPETYPPLVAGVVKPATEKAIEQQERADVDAVTPPALVQPAKNASLAAWQEYAHNRPESGLGEDEITTMTRDSLAAHFTE